MKDQVKVQAPVNTERNELIDEVVATLGANYHVLRQYKVGK